MIFCSDTYCAFGLARHLLLHPEADDFYAGRWSGLRIVYLGTKLTMFI